MADGTEQAIFSVSDRAVRRIAAIMHGEPAGSALRVEVRGGGCSGFQYDFSITQEKGADDLVFGTAAATVYVDPLSLQYMAGAELDYTEDLLAATFVVRNPLATAGCGCGTSFSL